MTAVGRVAVIGDLAGHRRELERELTRLGARDGRLPDDLTVIQVGDLIHRGPDSDGVIRLVDHYLTTQPEQWRQLVGNHEAQYLHERAFEWPEHISDDAAGTLNDWWLGGGMRVAAAISTADEDLLVTHAGVTAGFWEQALDRPPNAEPAARALNSFIGHHDAVIFAPGSMLGGEAPNPVAGPVWADAATELAASWLTEPLPFSQVHGHSMIVDRRRRQLRCSPEIAEAVTVDQDAGHETVTLDGGRIVGVDPGHGTRARHPWRALVLEQASVL